MSDPLTKEERDALDLARRLTSDGDERSIFAHEAALVAMVDRLVAEVDRLRELNEMLAGVVRRTAQDDTADCDGARDYVIAALSALNPSGPNSSGGET